MTNLEGQEEEEQGFCHNCKQLKSKFLLVKCNYNSFRMGPVVPAHYTVKDVTVYNSKSNLQLLVDVCNKSSTQSLMSKLLNDKTHDPYEGEVYKCER